MKVLFFSEDQNTVEQLMLALRMRWPDLVALVEARVPSAGRAATQNEPDLTVLCRDLQASDIWAVIQAIRHLSDVPIIVVAPSDNEMGVVKALELGADDYVRVPCDLMEVIARVAALMRRVGLAKRGPNQNAVECGELLIDPAAHEAFLGPSRLDLIPTEFKLLYVLAKHRHVTLSQRFIRRAVWPGEADENEGVKKYIQRLRRKLGDDTRNPDWITTVHGVGYRFSSPNASAS